MPKPLLAIALLAAAACALLAQPGAGLDLHDDPLPAGALARLGTLRLRTPQRVNCLTLSPDGKTLLAGNPDNKVQSWDVATGRLVAEWAVGHSALYGLQFSHDGKTLVASCGDGGVRLVDPATGRVRRQFFDTPRRYGQLIASLSPDGRVMVTAQRMERQVSIWDMSTGKVKHRVTGFASSPGYVPTFAFTPDSRHFVAVWTDGRIHLVDVATGKSVRALDRDGGKGNPATGVRSGRVSNRRPALALSPDGKTLVYRPPADRTFRVVEVATGNEVKRLERADRNDRGFATGALAISPNGRFLFESNNDGVIRVWGLASGKLMRELTTPTGVVQHLCLSRDGTRVAAASGQVLNVWDVAEGRPLHGAAGHQTGITRLAFTPDGRRLISFDHGSVHVWETHTGRPVQSARGKGPFGQATVGLSADGGTVSWVGYDGGRYSLRIGADRDPVSTRSPHNPGPYGQHEVSPDGRYLAGIHDENRRLRLVHLDGDKADRELALLPDDHRFTLAFSPDSRRLALSWPDLSLTIFDVATGGEVQRIQPSAPGDDSYRSSLAFSRDGRTLVYFDGELRLIEVLTGGDRSRFPREPGVPGAMALSDEGRLAARGQPDGTVLAYDAWTGLEVFRRKGDQGAVYSLAISRDNRLLASGGENTTALVWEVPPLPPAARQALTDEEAWADLGKLDATAAWKAMLHLTAQSGAASLIVEQLKPKPAGDPKRAAKLVEALDSDSYAERERAAAELEKLGHGAEEALKLAARSPSLEVKRRAEALLAKLEPGRGTSPSRLRRERAIEVLERLGERKALRQLLEARPDEAFAEAIREALARLGESP